MKPNQTQSECLERLNEIFRDVFDDEDLIITRETSADDIAEWDSVMHVSLIIEIEKAFGIRFSSTEVAQLQNVGDLVDLINTKAVK